MKCVRLLTPVNDGTSATVQLLVVLAAVVERRLVQVPHGPAAGGEITYYHTQ